MVCFFGKCVDRSQQRSVAEVLNHDLVVSELSRSQLAAVRRNPELIKLGFDIRALPLRQLFFRRHIPNCENPASASRGDAFRIGHPLCCLNIVPHRR